MAYSEFAYYYDDLNAAADYDALCADLVGTLHAHGIEGGILADLGCGTGEVSMRLAAAGYDVICVDGSEDMLAVFREKLAGEDGAEAFFPNPDTPQQLLLLHQQLEALDLYGTIRAAVCTFDTLNHLAPDAVAEAIRRVALFMEPGGIFLFDANTPYKHRVVLAGNSFEFADDGFVCRWQNAYQAEIPATHVTISAAEDGETVFSESFLEYEYGLPFWEMLLAEHGFELLEVKDGESYKALTPQSQRYAFVCRKK